MENLIIDQSPRSLRKLKSRIMYIENKSNGLDSAGRIGRIYFSRTMKTLYYKQRIFRSLNGRGFKSNYYDIETREEFWISGFKLNQNDRLYGGNKGVQIDDDVKDDYIKCITNKSAQQVDAPEPASRAR